MPNNIFPVTWQTTTDKGYSVAITVDNEQINIDQKLKMEVKAEGPLNFDKFTENFRDEYHHNQPFTLDFEEKQANQTTYYLEPWQGGEFLVGPLAIHFDDASLYNDQEPLYSDVFLVKVHIPEYITQNERELLHLYTVPTIEISDENKKLIQNKQEQHNNQQKLQKRQLPWKKIFAAALFLIVLYLVKRLYRQEKHKQVDKHDPKQYALQQLQMLKM